MPNIQIGYLKSPAIKGDRVTVYFKDGKSDTFTAANDLTSTKVAVLGDRVWSEDAAREELMSTTRLFKSKQVVEDNEDYPWGYLFVIDNFQTFNGTNGFIGYTDPSWNLDHLQGHFKAFGDGGGDYKTEESMLEDHEQYIKTTSPYYALDYLEQNENIINIFDERIQYTGVGKNSRQKFARSDGVHFFQMPVVFNANEKNRQIQNVTRPIYPERNYWIEEKLLATFYTVVYQSVLETGEVWTVIVVYFNNGSVKEKTALYQFGSPTLSRYFVAESGEITEAYRLRNNNPNEDWKAEKRQQLISLLSAITGAISAPVFSQLGNDFNNRVFTGQQIINDEVTVTYTVQSGFPRSIDTDIGTLSLNLSSSSSGNAYVSRTYLIPERVPRNPGVKDIYFQSRDNKKKLLHQIPTFETWDGYVSPLSNGDIEVVLMCGKKFPQDRSLSNYSLGRQGAADDRLYDREWSQVRVYLLDDSGNSKQTKVFNNSGTFLNPGDTAQEIEISSDNWQKQWLNSYLDWRKSNAFAFRTRSGPSADLNTGYRTYLSEVQTDRVKGIEATQVSRQLIRSTGYGTSTTEGFVYLDPSDLFDQNIDLDDSFSFGTSFFPSRNYSVFSGLANRRTNKTVYYITQSAYANNTFDSGFAIEKSTNFPELDFSSLSASNYKLPGSISSSDWNTEWSVEPGIETDLLKFGIKAIAFLG